MECTIPALYWTASLKRNGRQESRYKDFMELCRFQASLWASTSKEFKDVPISLFFFSIIKNELESCCQTYVS